MTSLAEAARFWLMVNVKSSPAACWPWTGTIAKNGYGRAFFKKKLGYAHRAAFFFSTGKDPGKKLVLHACDNRPCCNPAHLFLGNHKDNMQDCSRKGRIAHGEKHYAATITEKKAKQIRALATAGLKTTQIAKLLGVDRTTIWLIAKNKTWKHVRGA